MPKRKRVQREHTEDWQSIQQYTLWSEQTAYELLRPVVLKGLPDKSHARKAPRMVTMEIANEIRKKQENPLIGEWRMHAALLQEGIKVSPRTCGRIMAKHRALSSSRYRLLV